MIRAVVPAVAAVAALARPAAAAPPATMLFEHVPDGAIVAGSVAPSAFTVARAYLAQTPDMQKDVGDFLVRRVGVDLTRVDSFAFWSTSLAPAPTFAVFLHLGGTQPPALRGTSVKRCEGVALVDVGKSWVAAAQPGGILAGDEREVCLALAVAMHRAPALGGQSPLAALLAQPAGWSLSAALAASALRDPQLRTVAQTFGIALATLQLRTDGQIVLALDGDGQKLAQAQALVNTAMTNQIAQLKLQHDAALTDDKIDVGTGLTVVAGYHQLTALWKELAPRLEGNRLVSRYQLPELKTGNLMVPMIGVMAGVAIPAFTKYVRRSKTVEATMNVRRLADSAVAYYEEGRTRKGVFAWPKSTDWTPARGCCGQPGDRCAVDTHAWDQPMFRALAFSVDDPHSYQYRVTAEGRGKKARLVVEARGDLDCDGHFSSYRRVVTLDGDGGAARITPLEIHDDVE